MFLLATSTSLSIAVLIDDPPYLRSSGPNSWPQRHCRWLPVLTCLIDTRFPLLCDLSIELTRTFCLSIQRRTRVDFNSINNITSNSNNIWWPIPASRPSPPGQRRRTRRAGRSASDDSGLTSPRSSCKSWRRRSRAIAIRT